VNLSWTYVNGTTPATGFYVFRKTGAGAFAQIATLTTTTVKAYSDVTVAPATTYTYYVVAYTAGNPITLSAQSNNATVVTGLVAPVNLAVRSLGTRTATIGWQQPNTTGVSGYYVQRAVGNGAFATIATVTPATTLTFTNNLLTTGQRYSYRVQAFGAAGLVSAYSNVISFTAQ
jgi:fibronectin type 3 domain-containing protein